MGTNKFKAWDKVNKKWIGDSNTTYICVDGDVVVKIEYAPFPSGGWEPKSCRQLTWKEINNLVIVRYTGIKDRYFNEIYEGDKYKTQQGFVGIVEWNDLDAGFKLRYKNGTKEVVDWLCMYSKGEVIGNELEEIYKNT